MGKARPRGCAREQILDAASELFYRDGYHAVGVDAVVARSGVAKMTLYRHFPSKNQLVAGYLERADGDYWAWLDGQVDRAADPADQLVATIEAVATLAASPECLGCAFQAAAAEFPDPGHPGHEIALAHKQRMLARFESLARDAGLVRPAELAAQLLLLTDGAWAAARMFGPGNHARAAVPAARALVAAHRPEPDPMARS